MELNYFSNSSDRIQIKSESDMLSMPYYKKGGSKDRMSKNLIQNVTLK